MTNQSFSNALEVLVTSHLISHCWPREEKSVEDNSGALFPDALYNVARHAVSDWQGWQLS